MGRTSDPDRETDRPNPFLEGPRPTETVFQKTSGSENRTETELQKSGRDRTAKSGQVLYYS